MTKHQHLTVRTAAVLAALRSKAEGEAVDGFKLVYLDNAKPEGMSPTAFAGHLGALQKAGLYKVIDEYAWGNVKMF
jgi:hypothetical protein